jgi:hypothetical protein
MLVVGIIALDFGWIRAVVDLGSQFLLLLYVLITPMANILAAGLLLAFLRPRTQQFLKGFEVFGAMALVFVVVLAMRAEGLVQSYLGPAMALDQAMMDPPPFVGEMWADRRLLVGLFLLLLWATWPQFAFALMGGFLSRRSGATGRPDRTTC